MIRFTGKVKDIMGGAGGIKLAPDIVYNGKSYGMIF